MPPIPLSITSVPGIRVGHATHATENSGCTVIIPDKPATTGIDIRGSAPGTRETELLRPTFLVREVHGIMLSGGSAFGLQTADGAMDYFRERKIGFDANGAIVPIVPAAVIFDLTPGRDPTIPDRQMGYQACRNAGSEVPEGRVGAGAGALVGKLNGLENSMPGGIGSSAFCLSDDLWVGALVVANPLGDVIDPANGNIIAGAKTADGKGFADSLVLLKNNARQQARFDGNTTLAVVATNGRFDREGITKIAQMAQSGITRATRPAHTMFDGDLVFAMSCGDKAGDVTTVGAVAAELVATAIVRAVKAGSGKR